MKIADIILNGFWWLNSFMMLKMLTTLSVQWCSDRHHYRVCKFIHMLYLKIVARAKKGEVIALRCYKGQVLYSVAEELLGTDFKLSYVNWQLQITPIWLYEDGTVSRPHGEISHIQNWLPIDTEKRTFMILQGARGFEF